jgi:hypothetical protein
MAQRWMTAAVLICLMGIMMGVMSKEVHVMDIGEDAKANKDPAAGPTGAFNANDGGDDSWGRATGTRTLNMPGPAYGNPGYKESHNWEQDTDLFAPVVFDWKFYQAMYPDDLADMTEAAVKQYWAITANADDKTYPNCHQASDQFSMNMYYRANPGLEATTGGVCKMIVEDYLSNGIYDGKPTFLAGAEKSFKDALSADDLVAYLSSPKGKARAQKMRRGGSETEWALNRQNGDLGQVIEAVTYYSYTFWFMLENTVEPRGNIMVYGDNSPKISTAPNHGKYLEVISAQTNTDQWGCNTPDTDEFRIVAKEWTHVAVVAEDKKLKVYLNAKLAVECENDAGEMVIYKEKTLNVPANEDYADGKIKNLKYWGGSPLNMGLIAVQHAAGADA